MEHKNWSSIVNLHYGNIRQRDIGTYYIQRDNCNNIDIWMPFKNYVNLNSNNYRYLSIPNDSCNNLYLITGIPNGSDLSFSNIIYDLQSRKNTNVDFYRDLELPVE